MHRASSGSRWPWFLGGFFIIAGANHFLNPQPYLAMMPGYLPWPGQLVWWSGVAEVLGGIGVCVPQTRRAAGWSLIALLIAVYPANIHVALHGWPGSHLPSWALWVRLPLQFLGIWWVWRTCVKPKTG